MAVAAMGWLGFIGGCAAPDLPKIAPIVKQTAEEFGVPYLENQTFGEAFRSHVSALKRFGRMPDLVEAIG